MNITSAGFLFFITVAVGVYYCIPLRFRWIGLLLSSLVFIQKSNGLLMIAVMIVMITVTWLAGLVLEKKKSKGVLWTAMLVNAGFLIGLKEINFFLGTARILGNLFHHPLSIENLSLLAPLGISYYALTMISYLLDVYWGVGSVQKNLAKFALFAGYFPALTSGPILRYRETEETLYLGHRFHYQTFCFGIQRILWGFFKKLVLSERLAVIVNTVYGDPFAYPGFYVWIAILCFVFQLYTDFSGCIDIILGVSELFGVTLPENFDAPFVSKNLSEFWRRWHITLGAWLRDYILYPILKTSVWQKIGKKTKKYFGKKLGKKFPVWMAMFLSWFLIGFWHGGAWNYIIGVGLYFWALIVLGELCEPVFQWLIQFFHIQTKCFSFQLFQSLRTFGLFAVGLSFFRSYGGFMEGIQLYKAAFSAFNPWIFFDGSLSMLGLDIKDFVVLLAGLGILCCSGILKGVLKRPLRHWLSEQNLGFRWLIYYALIFSVLIFGCYGIGYDAQAFIYMGF